MRWVEYLIMIKFIKSLFKSKYPEFCPFCGHSVKLWHFKDNRSDVVPGCDFRHSPTVEEPYSLCGKICVFSKQQMKDWQKKYENS